MKGPAAAFRVVATFALLSVVTACGSAADGEPGETSLGPYDPAAEIRPELIAVAPDRVTPGTSVEILFPDGRVRGIHYVLESRQDDEWNLEWHLISDWGEGREPQVYRAESLDGIGIEDIGIAGDGPDLVMIPANAAPGDYRICTGNSRPNICALLTIESGS